MDIFTREKVNMSSHHWIYNCSTGALIYHVYLDVISTEKTKLMASFGNLRTLYSYVTLPRFINTVKQFFDDIFKREKREEIRRGITGEQEGNFTALHMQT